MQNRKQISVEFSYTANLGNFESAKIQIGMARVLGPDENEEEVIDEEFKFVQDKVFDKVDELLDKKEI